MLLKKKELAFLASSNSCKFKVEKPHVSSEGKSLIICKEVLRNTKMPDISCLT